MRVIPAAEQSLACYSPRAVPLPAAQWQKGFPWLGKQHTAWFDTAHGSRLLLPPLPGLAARPKAVECSGGVTAVCSGCSTQVCWGPAQPPVLISTCALCLAHHGRMAPARAKWLTWLERPPGFVVLLPPCYKPSDPCLEPGESDLEFNFSFSLGALTATLSSCTAAICWAEAMTVSVLHPLGFAGVRGQLTKCEHFGKLPLVAEALPFGRS